MKGVTPLMTVLGVKHILKCQSISPFSGVTIFLQKERANLGAQISQWIRLVGYHLNHGFKYDIYGRPYQE